ncbi:MAG: (d)CMP kinase [Chloroflexota bacterium]
MIPNRYLARAPHPAGGHPISDSLARSIAIDGPTASGKSVVGRAVADRLQVGFVDTGLMYRACTLAVLAAGIDPQQPDAVIELVRELAMELEWPRELSQPHVVLAGEDVTSQLRTLEIEHAVSFVSGVPAVRDELVRRQRAIADHSSIVMAGRDIGTRVLTEARTKIFLEASAMVRAQRRLGEELDSGRQTTFERVLDETRRRDEMDNTGQRAIHREQAADDAIIIDTDMLGIDDVVERCVDAYRAANGD